MEKLTDITNIKYLLQLFANKGSAKKSFGQNFLTSEHVLDQIIKAAEISDQDTIIEIGPGLGVLTHELTQRAKKVIAIEMDHEMMNILQKTLAKEPTAKNLTLIEQDALKFDPSTNPITKNQPYKLVANLPYNVATPILEKFLVNITHQPTLIVVLVQKEVAEKICEKTGDLSVLSLMFQPYGHASVVSTVPPSAFYPAPKVTSAILKIKPYATPLLPENLRTTYLKLLHAAFSQKRKMLHTSLQQIMSKEEVHSLLAKAKISPDIRPQNLALEQWIHLAQVSQS